MNCDRTLAILSPDHFTGKFSEMEWMAVLYAGKLLTARVADFEVPGHLGPQACIDFVSRSEEEALRQLLGGIKPDRAKPATVSYHRLGIFPQLSTRRYSTAIKRINCLKQHSNN